jgi:Concanavalin A-like lectin/glucanases superfamily
MPTIKRLCLVVVLALGLPGSASADLWSNLVGWWTFDEMTGTTARNSSGTGNTGTLTNMDAGTDWITGPLRGALDFDGANDHIVLPAITSPTTAISIAAWVFVKNGVTGHQDEHLVMKQNSASEPWYSYVLALSGISTELRPSFCLGLQANGTQQCTAPQTVTLTAGVWHHIAATWASGENLRLYLNGAASETSPGTVTGTLVYNAAFVTYIAFNSLGTVYTDANMDDVRLYTRRLTAGEITALYNWRAGHAAPQMFP